MIFRLAFYLAFILLLIAKEVAAYQVIIDMPGASQEIQNLLTQHLDLVSTQTRDGLDDDQIRYMLNAVPENVTALLATEGYLSPITKTSIESDKSGTIQSIRLHILLGQRTLVSGVEIVITDGDAISHTPVEKLWLSQKQKTTLKNIKDGWPLKVGQAFRQTHWDEAKKKGLETLQKKYWAAAKITKSKATIDPDHATADLTVHYETGPIFTLGKLEITGTQRYPAWIIEHVNPITVGQYYTLDRLLLLQKQIRSTPYFRNVKVDIDPQQAVLTPMKVHVTEFPMQQLRGGLGYGTDTGGMVQGRYSHYNLFDRAWLFDSQIRLEQRHQYAALGLSVPPDQKGYVNSINNSIDYTTVEGIDLRSIRLGFKYARMLENTDITWSLDYYNDYLAPIHPESLPAPTHIVIPPGRHHALVPGVTWTKHDVDSQIFPRQGRVFSIQLGGAIGDVLSDQSFLRLLTRFKQFFPIAKRDVMTIRVDFGGIFNRGTTSRAPASLLFRAGGTKSVRGYAYNSIGNAQQNVIFPTRYLLTGSVEYQHWLNTNWGAAIFYDIGTATNQWSQKQTKVGIGLGLRYRTPIGTINGDIAYSIQAKKFRPHVSLGWAF